MNDRYLSLEEYNQIEEEKNWPHEYINGQVVPREESNISHSTATTNVAVLLGQVIRDRADYVGFAPRVKYHVADENVSLYPDFSIAKKPLKRSGYDTEALADAILIVEVLSENSAAYDRGEKFSYYRQLPSLQEYILVELERWIIETRYKNPDGSWQMEWFGDRSPSRNYNVTLKSFDIDFPMNKIYLDVDKFNYQEIEKSSDVLWKRKWLLNRGASVFGSARSFNNWLNKPYIGLNTEVPVNLLNSSKGINTVWNMVERIAHGIPL